MIRILWQKSRRIGKDILGVKGFKKRARKFPFSFGYGRGHIARQEFLTIAYHKCSNKF